MAQKSREDKIRDWFLEICPQAVTSIRDLISDPSTPISSKVQLIGMVLERALGKAETPLKVTTTVESMEMAEERLMEIIHEIQAEDEQKEAAEGEYEPLRPEADHTENDQEEAE
jgi:hypothetical protein